MIKIITVGKIKEKYLTDAINEYLKRLSKYTKINLIEVPDENFDITKTIETEKKSILKYVSEKDYIITMEIEGKELSSIEFAKKIDEIQISNSNICFIIGGLMQLKHFIGIFIVKVQLGKMKDVLLCVLWDVVMKL